jgi:dipeptidyl aminopeptidase/acylaminoacyl peptidase
MKAFCTISLLALGFLPLADAQLQKPPIALDEFMNATEIRDARISPDGSAAVICIGAPDWQQNRFKEDLWLWTKASGRLIPLTHSGHDSSPEWSPDGRYIAFLSDRPLAADGSDDKEGQDKNGDGEPSRIWLIPTNGGEAFPLYKEKLDAHTFAWSPDSSSIDFSVTTPLSKEEEDAHKAEWKDVIRWREQERGDVLLAVPVDAAIGESDKTPEAHPKDKTPEDKTSANKPQLPQAARVIARSTLAIDEIVPSPSGEQIAFETGSISLRLENPSDAEMFLVAAQGGDAQQLTHNLGLESRLTWSPSGKSIYFMVHAGAGSIEGPYQDVQGRIYSLDVQSTKATRLGADFKGSWEDFAVTPGNEVIAEGLTGMDQHLYRVDGTKFEGIATVPGNYGRVDASRHGTAVLFTHSTITDPTQVYVSDSPAALNDAKPITSLNPIFAERAQVTWEPYRWKSDDGTSVEGVLIYPPGKKGAKHLRMLTLIHGGPEDADGDHFGADWYDWATLAAANGWLVFRPNYRGSTGYGDAFMLAIMPHLVSAPGHDILSGVDALVKDGTADPDHLTIGGYSYGGYMTNWLITQTTRFKAAVTGAGAVEHAANWGNDDLTWDDAWYLSGTPWEKPELYQSEAALFQMNKVTTPTHIVGGNADVRVSYLEDVLLERALQRLNVPHTLLVFPGENHPLDKNPWHGYVKVREELKWLEKYGEK